VELAATPAWFADNVAQIAIVTLLVLTVLVVRLVQKLSMRLLLLGLIAGVGLFVYLNRDALEQCARTCECEIADRDISVPICDPDIELDPR
jgi:hypothetical protein